MTDVTIRRLGLSLALTAALLAAALVLIGRAGADDGDGLPAPEELRVAAERGSLDVTLDWDDVPGADSYLVRWRRAVRDSKLSDGVHVQSSNAAITVASYGKWVARVQSCDDAGCGAPAAKKFKARRPRAVPDITPLPTASPTPLPASAPTPEPVATATPDPSAPIPDEPTGLSISATADSLEMSVDWDDVPGASYYWLRWRVSGPGNELNGGVVVLPSEVVIALWDYGEWVARVQACNHAGCGAPVASKFTVEHAPTATPTPEPVALASDS